MTEQLIEIGRRLGMLRESVEFSAERMAEALEMTCEDYLAFEKGENDFSFSFLYNAASVLGVDVLDIMSGESPKLSTCCVVHKGGGYAVDRRKAYSYKHLAFTFRDKKAEPFMVEVEPKPDSEQAPEQHAHDGQEFDYMVAGSMEFFIGDMVYTLEEGDSVYFNANIPHAMRAKGDAPAKFLAVVMK